MSETMIERVAKAMVVNDSGPEGSTLYDIHMSEFGDGYRDSARAAIEAIYTGMTIADDEFMRSAVKGYHDISERDWRSSMPKDFFRLAISNWMKAALKEPTP